MIAPLALAGLLSSCARGVDARTAAAIVAVESGGNEYAVNDNTTGRAYFPASLGSAKALVGRLAGHQLAVGIAQVDSVNFARLGVDAERALDPCTSLQLGAQILLEDYRREYPRATGATEEKRRQDALRRALSLYNSGSPTAAPEYASRVVEAVSSSLVRETTALVGAGTAGRSDAANVSASHEPLRPLRARLAYVPASASSVFAGAAAKVSGTAFVVEAGR